MNSLAHLEKTADFLTDSRKHLAEMRGLHKSAEHNPPRRHVVPYTKAVVMIFEGVQLDAERKVLDAWLDTNYDQITSCRIDTTQPAGCQTDAGDGYGISMNQGGPFRVRSLHRPSLGEVREVNAVEYWMLKREYTKTNNPRWEPVPGDTELRGPIFPKNFPSSWSKARTMAARGLRKPADELRFKEILAWFSKTKPGPESFTG